MDAHKRMMNLEQDMNIIKDNLTNILSVAREVVKSETLNSIFKERLIETIHKVDKDMLKLSNPNENLPILSRSIFMDLEDQLGPIASNLNRLKITRDEYASLITDNKHKTALLSLDELKYFVSDTKTKLESLLRDLDTIQESINKPHEVEKSEHPLDLKITKNQGEE